MSPRRISSSAARCLRPTISERCLIFLRVDMTNYTDDDAALLARFKLYGPPAILLLEPLTGTEKVRVVGYQTPDEFVKSLSAP
jgi:thiol:disulfide interchange protein